MSQKANLHNPIDDEIKEISQENQDTATLLTILKAIKAQYATMKIEQMKLNIDKIMSSTPACIDPELVRKSVAVFVSNLDKETQTLASKHFAKRLNGGNDVRSTENVKDAIFNSQQNSSQFNSNSTGLLPGQNPFK